MERIEGFGEGFVNAKTIMMTTFGRDGERHDRPMMNLNRSPYEPMDFTTYKETRKVEDILGNPEIIIGFPGRTEDEYFEITGRAGFEPDDYVQERWEFWYSELHPWAKAFFWFPRFLHHGNWAIIRVYPELARRLSR